jgi:hypothetical protein
MEGGKAGDIQRYSFLSVFANDGTIDARELEYMKRLALADERVDDDERRVLSGIFSRVTEATVDPAVWDDIERFKLRHGID